MPNTRGIRYLVIIILILLLVVAGYYLVKSPPSFVKNTQFVDSSIVFTGSKSGSSGALAVYSMGKDGRVMELAAPGFTDPINASVSADLTKISFVAMHDGKLVVAVMNADGSNTHQVSKLEGPKTMPSWSQGGNKILYSLSKQGGGVAEIDLLANTDQVVAVGTDLVQTPAWLPDGLGFTYTALDVDRAAGATHSHFEVYRNGISQEVKFAGDKNGPFSDLGTPAVSPNGKLVAFVRSSDNKIYISGLDGKSVRLLTKAGSSLFACPSWSADSSFLLASESDNQGKSYISKINLDDGSITRSQLSGFDKINCPRMTRY